MLITARAEYACLAMLELASRFEDMKPVRLSEITDKHDIPQRFLVQILLQMKSAGYVNTTRGAAGGYQLSKHPSQITLAEIVNVLDRMEEPEERTGSSSAMAAVLQRVWKGLSDAHLTYLERFRLSELLPQSIDAEYVI